MSVGSITEIEGEKKEKATFIFLIFYNPSSRLCGKYCPLESSIWGALGKGD